MEKEKGKTALLRWLLSVIIGLAFIFEMFPNILGWNRNDIWIIGMPISLFCVLLWPAIMMLCLAGIYFIDANTTKKKRLWRISQMKGGNK